MNDIDSLLCGQSNAALASKQRRPQVRVKNLGQTVEVKLEQGMRLVPSAHLPHALDLLWGKKGLGVLMRDAHNTKSAFFAEEGVQVIWL